MPLRGTIQLLHEHPRLPEEALPRLPERLRRVPLQRPCSYLRIVPAVTVVAPKDAGELGPKLPTAREPAGRVAWCYPCHCGAQGSLDDHPQPWPGARAEVPRQDKGASLWAAGKKGSGTRLAAVLPAHFGVLAGYRLHWNQEVLRARPGSDLEGICRARHSFFRVSLAARATFRPRPA